MLRGCDGFLGIDDEPRFGPLFVSYGSLFGPLKTDCRFTLGKL